MPTFQSPSSGGYGAAGAGLAAGVAGDRAYMYVKSTRSRANWGLGIVAVLAALEVVSSSDLASDTTTAQNLAIAAQAMPLATVSAQSTTTIFNEISALRSHAILQDNLMANIAYHANIFAFTPPVQQNAPLQAGAITATATTVQNSNTTAFVFLALAALVILAVVYSGG